MMNDRFSVQLRQHLLETANERPADGQLAAIVEHVAVTPQRRRLISRLPGFPVRIGPFPPMVRYGLIAVALVLAAVAGAILFGGGAPSPSRGTVFEGRWTATDPTDESTLTLIVGEGRAPVVQFQDDLSTGSGCAADEVKIFRADGVGEITGNRLRASYPDGGGCGIMLVLVAGLYDYDADTDTLLDPDGVTWTRVPAGGGPPPTLRPAPKPNPGQTVTAACFDLANGGTYTSYAGSGSISLTATVPSTPAIPWNGVRDEFQLSASCESVAPLAFFASTATSVYETSCMPEGAYFTTFAEAIARLDTPAGDDISERIDLTIDGHAAARYDISNLTTCPEGFGLWHGTALGPGETGSVYVIDVDGVLLAIELNRDGSQTPAELEEAYGIVASLKIAR